MWGLGAIRDGAAGLVKHGAGAVKHGVEAGAKLLENLDEVMIKDNNLAGLAESCDPRGRAFRQCMPHMRLWCSVEYVRFTSLAVDVPNRD